MAPTPLSAVLRLPLAVAYPFLAHWASVSDSDRVAGIALVDLVLILLVGPLLAMRVWAWVVMAACVAAVVWLVQVGLAQLPLLAPPMLFTGLLAWMFLRSLIRPRQPVITTIVSALEACPADQLAPDLLAYTRRLTAAWGVVLGVLCLTNGVLGLIAVPNGLLVRLGHAPLVALPQAGWSWFANFIDYGLVGVFFLAEYAYRQHRFPERPYRHFGEFLQRMAALGPLFWQRVFR